MWYSSRDDVDRCWIQPSKDTTNDRPGIRPSVDTSTYQHRDVGYIRAYIALHLVGTPSQETGTSPLDVYSLTTVYTSPLFPLMSVKFKVQQLGISLAYKSVNKCLPYESAVQVLHT